MKVVKATKIMTDGNPIHRGGKRAATEEKPAYLIPVNKDEDGYFIFLCGGTSVAQTMRANYPTMEWGLMRSCDKWEECPPEDWPDEVCVAVAQYVLIGKTAS